MTSSVALRPVCVSPCGRADQSYARTKSNEEGMGMFRRLHLRLGVLAGLLWFGGSFLLAQQTPPQEMVLYNGKIVTVDDGSNTSRIGTIGQAMHVKDGKVQRVGANAQIRALAGPNARVVDLKGRTVLPGLIGTHDHPHDFDAVNRWIVKKVIPEDVVVSRFLDGSPEENLSAFPKVLGEAVSKARPGQWIYIVVELGKNWEYSAGARGLFDKKIFNILDGKRIPKEMLDAIAPNNPVLVRDVFTGTLMNELAVQQSREVWKDYPEFQDCLAGREGPGVSGAGPCGAGNFLGAMRWAFPDVMMRNHYALMREVYRLGTEWWAGYGETAVSSSCFNPMCVQVYDDLDRSGQMAMRWHFGWAWVPRSLNESFTRNFVNAMAGRGSDYFWFGGFSNAGVIPGFCTTATPVSTQYPARTWRCDVQPNHPDYMTLFNFLKSGGRFSFHSAGDKDIDGLLEVIEKASKEAGMTDEQIRAKRHTFDHGSMAPRPDQLDKIKRLGLIASQGPAYIYEDAPPIFAVYGERVAEWNAPHKRIVDAGIHTAIELDRPLGSTDFTFFHYLYWVISRKAWDGKVYVGDQRVSREIALKSATRGGAYYILRDSVLGSLEPGKWADFIILDRDYLTIPEDDIPNIRVLMTSLGGKVVHLVPSLAKELGMEPTGAQVTLGFHPSKW